MAAEVTRLRDLKKNGARDLIPLDPHVIVIDEGFNPRDYRLPENRAHLDWLKSSIKLKGVEKPIEVRWEPADKLPHLVDGECRLRSCLELIDEGVDIEKIWCYQVPGNNEADRLVRALTANTGKSLSKWEVGGAFRKLIGYGWDTSKIGEHCGYSERYINEAVELTDAPEAVKHLLSVRAVTPALALDHIRKHGSNASITLTSKVDEARSKGGKAAMAKRAKKPSKLRSLADAVRRMLDDEDYDSKQEYITAPLQQLRELLEAIQ